MTVNRTHSIKRRKITTNILYHTIISLISIGMLYPLLWMLSSSFKPNKEIFSTEALPESVSVYTLVTLYS